MAYNPYPNQPYQYQDQLTQLRNAPMQYPYPMPQQPRQEGLNWVQGEAGAKSWFVAPGATVLLMDSEARRFYLKSADPSGMPTMRTFEYSEVGGVNPPEAPQTAGFVTMEVFENFRNEVTGKLDELSAPVEVSLSRKKKGAAENE